MFNLKAYRSGRPGFADLLPWSHLHDSGLIVTKKGSFIAAWYFRPPDASSGTDEQAEYLSDRVNIALSKLGSGWSSWTDVVSLPAEAYPPREASAFPDPISRLIDEERRRSFESEGVHFENERVFVLSYLPPHKSVNKLTDLFYHDDAPDMEPDAQTVIRRIAENFEKSLQIFEDQIGGLIGLRRMQSYKVIDDFGREHLQDELVNYLHYTATGKPLALMLPAAACYLDAIIGGQEMWSGEPPIIGEDFVSCVVIDGFPKEHVPNITARLNTLPMPYRFSQRMIYMDPVDADKEIDRYVKRWGQKVRGFISILFSQEGTVNQHAQDMKTEAEHAKSAAGAGDVLFGWYSATVVLRHPARDGLEEMVRLVVRAINDSGFSARVETINTIEAFRSSLPGEVDCQIRRPLINTRNLADLLPLSGVWTGQNSAPCPLYPQPSPPLMYSATVGGIPFRINLHVGDVGHTLVFGPTGKGKSTLTATMALQTRRYPGMQIWCFDYKRGMLATAKACGGRHYELGGGDTPALCPLAQLDTPADLAWAEEWIMTCLKLQGRDQESVSRSRDQIHLALERLREHQDHRSLSDFMLACQDADVRSAMKFYTLEGAAGWMLDAREDRIATSDFNVFETLDLMPLGEQTSLPVLLAMFRRFERSLDGRPTFLFIAEAWMALGHPVWREKVRDWLKLLRSLNCSVIMDTQSLSDAVRSGLLDVLNESCMTKIYLPNEEALKRGTATVPGPLDFYEMMGLNPNQIEIIRTARGKRDYYLVQPDGCRLFDLALGPATLALAGATDKTSVEMVNALEAEHGPEWPYVYLRNKGVDYETLLTG